MKYFLYNKAVDFEKGYMENCAWREGGLTVEQPKLSGGGVFISRVMDSREKETVWHRLTTDCEISGNASIQMYLYASECDSILIDGREEPLQMYLHSGLVSVDEKQKRLSSCLVKTSLSPKDILLYDVQGRYLWVIIRMFSQGNHGPSIGRLQFFFPKESWSKYLPQMYRKGQGENSFLDRYLAIFQSMYAELENEIRQSERMLDTESTTPAVLEWLASWLSVENVSLWREERLRSFLREAVRLYGIRGTREGFLRIIELYIGQSVFLVEYMEVETVMMLDSEQRGKWERLFGTDRNCCFLLIMEDVIAEPGQKKALETLIDSVKPAHISIRLVALKSRVVLGSHCYLGVNAKLERLRPLVLDGTSHLAFSALKNK